jgi:hypothetical protein
VSAGLIRPDHHPAADNGDPIAWHQLRRILALRTNNLDDQLLATARATAGMKTGVSR